MPKKKNDGPRKDFSRTVRQSESMKPRRAPQRSCLVQESELIASVEEGRDAGGNAKLRLQQTSTQIPNGKVYIETGSVLREPHSGSLVASSPWPGPASRGMISDIGPVDPIVKPLGSAGEFSFPRRRMPLLIITLQASLQFAPRFLPQNPTISVLSMETTLSWGSPTQTI
jgi:hypothetical protein